jgi:hypothetical protein
LKSRPYRYEVGDPGSRGLRVCVQPSALPPGGLTLADAPLIDAEILFRQPGPPHDANLILPPEDKLFGDGNQVV